MTGSNTVSAATGLRIHAIVFACVIPIEAVINYFTGPPWWVLWVLGGWAIGLVSHWWFVSRHPAA